jgi:predicted regulator of Ras-like GTPase activity (Roadblock/LC7/MglB family)
MKRILQGLHTVDGIQAALVLESDGRVIAHQAHALYDLDLLEKVGQIVANTTDSIQVLHDDWDMLTASLTDGVLLLKNIRVGGAETGRTVLLVIVAETRLNMSFAGVAIRVAATKLKAMLEQPQAPQAAPAAPVKAAADVSSSGLSWTGVSGSMRPGSEVTVADTASATFLTLCTKALATHVGPMAKVFIKEALRATTPDRPFSLADGDRLLVELRRHIDDPERASQFYKQMRARLG